ncbi:lasso peptide biosynthesis B2 protein [Halomonas sp. M5N1S17]|uniref:lasso peptide biosynthesis B2 protein n=1 Tax=Halomonas alkalisoli TaxID=2907158 RepID=UPI001F3B6D14|nr:lasso peptide biosynthesis B2 protein [Halomonas alkalisoli]MCE9665081.1 lasso peptide biosynthesis B2 protein [Halomonas alkalisoli]
MRQFRRLTPDRRHLVLEAATGLALAWLLVRGFPFRYWCSLLGERAAGEVDLHPLYSDQQATREICWAVTAVNRATGDHFTCLMLAMAAQRMLSRRGISSSLVLGTLTERDEIGKLVIKAHAWLRVDGELVLGHHDGRFAALSSYLRRSTPSVRGKTP